MKAVLAIRDLKQLNLSLKLESKGEGGSTEITFINSQTETGMLHSQIKNLAVPPGTHLNRVRVFSSLDNALALNVFSFDNIIQTKQAATRADAPHIMEYINEIKEGTWLNHFPSQEGKTMTTSTIICFSVMNLINQINRGLASRNFLHIIVFRASHNFRKIPGRSKCSKVLKFIFRGFYGRLFQSSEPFVLSVGRGKALPHPEGDVRGV